MSNGFWNLCGCFNYGTHSVGSENEHEDSYLKVAETNCHQLTVFDDFGKSWWILNCHHLILFLSKTSRSIIHIFLMHMFYNSSLICFQVQMYDWQLFVLNYLFIFLFIAVFKESCAHYREHFRKVNTINKKIAHCFSVTWCKLTN